MKSEYYNTVPLQGNELKEKRKKTANQDTLILGKFRLGISYNPEYMERELCYKYPLHSIRRAFNTLEKNGAIERYGKILGNYGVLVNCYKLKL